MPNVVSPEFRRFPRFEGIRYSRSDSIESDYHLWFDNSNLRTDANLVIDGTTTFTGDLTAGGNLIFSAAVSQIIPGATSLSIRNNANTRDNWIITDAGAVTAVAQPGSGSGVAGNGYTFTTGTGGGGVANGGDFTLTLGAPTGSGRSGSATFLTTSPVGLLWEQVGKSFVVNEFGIGIGKPANAGAAVIGSVTYTDPTQMPRFFDSALTVTLTADNAWGAESANSSVYVNDGGHNSTTLPYQGADFEMHVLTGSSGTHANLQGVGSVVQLNAGSSANATIMYGITTSASVAGSGTATTAIGYNATVSIDPSGGAADGNITNGYVFQARLINNTSAVTPGVMALGRGVYIFSPGYSATGVITEINGIHVAAQFNTLSSTSTTGGFTSKGVSIALGNQGGNTSGTDTNYGVYITGNGGTAGGGGTVTNWAFYSTSTAPSLIGSLVIGQGSGNTADALYIHGSGTLTANQNVIELAWTLGSAATGSGAMIRSVFRTAASAFTMTTGYNVIVDTPNYGAASAVTTMNGIFITNQGAGAVTNGRAINIAAQSGSVTSDIGILNADDYCEPAGATGMTKGFVYIPSGAGPPTGAPANLVAGRCPLYYDSTNNFLYIRPFGGAWLKSTIYA